MLAQFINYGIIKYSEKKVIIQIHRQHGKAYCLKGISDKNWMLKGKKKKSSVLKVKEKLKESKKTRMKQIDTILKT